VGSLWPFVTKCYDLLTQFDRFEVIAVLSVASDLLPDPPHC